MLDGQRGRIQVEHAQQADQVLDADVRQLDEHAERAVQEMSGYRTMIYY
jgi:hypothetical protein